MNKKMMTNQEAAYRAEHADFLAKIATLCTGTGSDFWDKMAADLLSAFKSPSERQVALVDAEVARREKNAASGHFSAVGGCGRMAQSEGGGMGVDTLGAIAAAAWRKGAGEALIPGVGFVRIVRVESRGARYGDYVREFYLDGVKTTGAAVWRRVRDLDRAGGGL